MIRFSNPDPTGVLTFLTFKNIFARWRYSKDRKNEAKGVIPIPAPQQITVS